MYCREKTSREEKYKPRKGHRNSASFSSTLLDEIYRSIDAAGNAEKGGRDEHVAKPCLVEKWMIEKEANKIDHARRSIRQYSTPVSPEVLKTKKKEEDDLIKSRSKAYKVYARLKKMKQPISPGGKLTNFLNSLFNNNPNKSKKQNHTVTNTKWFHPDLKPNNSKVSSFSSSSSSSNCSSFSRSCPSRYSSESGEKKMRIVNEPERRVGFHPTSVIYGGDSKPPLPPNANAVISSLREKNREKNREALNVFKSYQNQRRSDFAMHHHYEEEDEEDDDDGISDSSSDLFELDHLASFGDNNGFSEELPVYGTTYYNRNNRVASGLFR